MGDRGVKDLSEVDLHAGAAAPPDPAQSWRVAMADMAICRDCPSTSSSMFS
jgi:hypothetical protein